MIEELCELLRRQVAALEVVEGRLRALELLAAAGEQRFVSVAFDELDAASERLAALELGRTLSLLDVGLGADATASDVVAVAAEDEAEKVAATVADLRLAATRVDEARARTHAVVADGHADILARLEASEVLAGV